MNFNLHEISDEDFFWHQLKSDFKKISPKTIAASGGSAAKLFDQGLDLTQSDIWIADERFVSESHQDSNAKLLRSKNIPENQLHTWKPGNFKMPQACAESYTSNLPNQFDLTILGVGPDGHTASLFPYGAWLDDASSRCIATQTTEFAIKERLSMSLSEIEKSKNIWILMMGAGKKDILKKIMNPDSDFHDLPARKVLDFGAEIYFLNV